MGNNVQISNGQNGGIYIADSNAHTPSERQLPWTLVQIIADAIFDSATKVNIEGLAASGHTIPAGTMLGGSWTTIKLTSGKVVAYKTP